MFAVEADGYAVETVESLSSDPRELHPVQQAFTEQFGLQCGFCTPAMVLRTKEILSGDRALSRDELRDEISGVLCRCTGYQQILDAIEAAQESVGDELRQSVVASGPSLTEDQPTAQEMED
jgi:aerobic-type carbon monoxide dehydrogenase small subunit (CoxS/CutS family)